jgi:hypothetical protein
VATLVYGADDPRTNELRRFRDEVLRTRRHGRRLVSLYYRLAPAVCRVTGRHPKALFLIRQCLDVTRWCLSTWFFRHTRKETQHGD